MALLAQTGDSTLSAGGYTTGVKPLVPGTPVPIKPAIAPTTVTQPAGALALPGGIQPIIQPPATQTGITPPSIVPSIQPPSPSTPPAPAITPSVQPTGGTPPTPSITPPPPSVTPAVTPSVPAAQQPATPSTLQTAIQSLTRQPSVPTPPPTNSVTTGAQNLLSSIQPKPPTTPGTLPPPSVQPPSGAVVPPPTPNVPPPQPPSPSVPPTPPPGGGPAIIATPPGSTGQMPTGVQPVSGPAVGLPGTGGPGPGGGAGPVTPFGPGNSLQFEQLNPTVDPATAAAQGLSLDAAGRVASGPDLQKSATDEYNAMIAQAAPAYQNVLRQALQASAAGGRQGSGLTTTELGDAALQQEKYQTNLAAQLAGSLAPAEAAQRVSNLNALNSNQANQFGENQTRYADLAGQQQYQAGQAQQAINNDTTQQTLQDALLNSEFNRQMGSSELGMQGAGIIGGEGVAQQDAAGQLLGTVGMQQTLASMPGYGVPAGVGGGSVALPPVSGTGAPGQTGAVTPGASAGGGTPAGGPPVRGPDGNYYDPATGQQVDPLTGQPIMNL